MVALPAPLPAITAAKKAQMTACARYRRTLSPISNIPAIFAMTILGKSNCRAGQ